MNGTENQSSRGNSSRSSQHFLVGNDEPSINNERPGSPSNLLIVSVTCCANDIWNGSSNSSELVVGDTVVSHHDEEAAVTSPKPVGDAVAAAAVTSKSVLKQTPPPIRIVVNKRGRMPVVASKPLIPPADAPSKELIAVISDSAPEKTPSKPLHPLSIINFVGTKSTKEVDVDNANSKTVVKTNHDSDVKCDDEIDVKPNVEAAKQMTELSDGIKCLEQPVPNVNIKKEVEISDPIKEEEDSPSRDVSDDKKSLTEGVIQLTSNKPVAVSPGRRVTRRRRLFCPRRRTRPRSCRRIVLKPDIDLKTNVDKTKENDEKVSENSDEFVLLPPLALPQRIKRKYVRKINTATTPSSDRSVADDVAAVTPEKTLSTPNDKSELSQNAIRSYKKKKGFHRNRCLGDLVWVKTSGRPWWPARVTEDPEANSFKRNKISSKRATSYMTEYHITTFGRPILCCWVLANYLLDFRGRKVFEDYVTHLMRPIPIDTVLYTQLKWRFCVKDSVREEWERIVKEIEDTYRAEIEEQREKDLKDPHPPRRIKKRPYEKQVNAGKSDEVPVKKRKVSPEGGVIKVKLEPEIDQHSSDGLQRTTARKRKGNLSMEANKSQKLLVKFSDNHVGKMVEEKMFNTQTTSDAIAIKTMKMLCSKLSQKNKNQEKVTRKGAKKTELETSDQESRLRDLLTANNDDSNSVQMKKRNKMNQQGETSNPKKRTRASEEPLANAAETSSVEQEAGVTPIKPKSKKQNVNGLTPTKKSVDRYVERVCHICEKMIMTEPTVRCHGICKSVVHVACANPPPSQHVPADEYKCETCITGNHACFVCKKTDGEVRPCRASHCGKLYHAECLDPFRSSRIDEQSVMCPSHSCMSCTLSYSRVQSFNGIRSYRCIRCPFAYHANDSCLPAGSLILSNSVIICPRHYKPKKARKDRPQHVNVNWCFVCSNGGSLICCESCPASFHAECLNIEPPEGSYYCCECLSGMQPKYGDIVWVKLGNYRWWPAKICNPKNVPINIRNLPHQVGEFPVCFFGTNDFHWTSRTRVFHFLEGDQGAHITSSSSSGLAKRFQTALAEACEAFKDWKAARDVAADRYNSTTSTRPPYYKHIMTNRPFGKVTMHTANLSMMTPCDCNPNSENPCGSDTECLNRMLMFECHPAVCLAGERCNNQRFQKRQYPPTETFLCEGKGWGLRCLTDIKKGEFVNEYVGEIIDEEECRRRMRKMHEENNTSYYFLTIDKDRIIDAAQKGNFSRFMNHSCRPNNETRKWTVNGDTRVGLFAVCDIPAGTELTFNYNLDCLGNEKILCKCGEPNCSEYIGERPKVVKPSSKKKLDTSRRKRRKNRLSRVEHDDLCFRCGEDGHLVLCDRKGCTKAFHLNCLDMKKPPYGRWECPWHHCYHCGKQSSALCLICPNSFCKDHTAGNINLLPDGSIYCNEHTDDPFEHKNVNETTSSTTKSVANELQMPSHSIIVDNETKTVDSETINSISFIPVKLNGAEITVKRRRYNRNPIVKQELLPEKKRSSRRRGSQTCKANTVVRPEEIKEDTVTSDSTASSERIEKDDNMNSSDTLKDEAIPMSDSDTLNQEVKPTPVKRKWRITAVKNGMIVSNRDNKSIHVSTKKKIPHESAPSQLLNVSSTTNKANLKEPEDDDNDNLRKTSEINENSLETAKANLKKVSESKIETKMENKCSSVNKDKPESTSAVSQEEENESTMELVKHEVNEEFRPTQIHCQDIKI